MLPATTAPVLPALTKASASPSCTSLRPTTRLDSVLLRAALAGSSWKPMTSGAWTTETCCAPGGHERPHGRLVAHEHHVQLRAGGLQRALDDVARRVVAAGRVDRDAHDAVAGRRRSRRP